MEAHARPAEKPFAGARAKFEKVVAMLSAPATLGMQHGALERSLHTEGMELLRLLFQDHLDLRGPGDVEGEVVGSDGRQLDQLKVRGRGLMTVFGRVAVNRQAYGAPGTKSVHPLDADLNLPPELYSHGMQRGLADEIRDRSFDGAVEAIARNTGGAVPKRQAEKLAARAAEDFDAFYATRSVASQNQVAETGPIGVIATDATGIVMHTEDLRPATQKAAKARQSEPATFSLGKAKPSVAERQDRKRMAQVAVVYTIAAFARTPEDIVGELDRVKAVGAEKKKRPKPEQKRVWASVKRDAPEIIADAFTEAQRRDPKGTKRWVGLVDGSESQLEYVLAASKASGLKITVILDLLHVADYVWKAGRVLNEDTAEERTWVRERLLEILRGRSSHVAAGMRRSATKRNLSAAERKAVDECADYLLKYRQYLRYDEYLAAGFPITTGLAEGACRHLVKDRMDLTGAVWRLESAEAVLKLRALHSSSDLDEYWTFHEASEHARHHASKYAAGAPPRPRTNRRGKPTLRIIR